MQKVMYLFKTRSWINKDGQGQFAATALSEHGNKYPCFIMLRNLFETDPVELEFSAFTAFIEECPKETEIVIWQTVNSDVYSIVKGNYKPECELSGKDKKYLNMLMHQGIIGNFQPIECFAAHGEENDPFFSADLSIFDVYRDYVKQFTQQHSYVNYTPISKYTVQ